MIGQRFRTRFKIVLLQLLLVPFLVQAQSSITLSVDATEAPRKILHARETIDVQPGPLILFYPKWIPGEHGPTGPISELAGLKISAGDKLLKWRRDLVEMYSVHVEVPAGVSSIDLAFDFLLPSKTGLFSAGASASAKLVVVNWNQVVLYPLDRHPDRIVVRPSIKLPAGWQFATALTAVKQSAGYVEFSPVSLTMLVDSPLMAGEYFRRFDLTPRSGIPHFLNIVSDDEAWLDVSPDEISAHRNLVDEALALFGAHHYDHYDFLYVLSDEVTHFGLEHHQSSDNRVPARTLVDSSVRKPASGLLPHEFVHSWNGKYRRPVGLATEDFSTPMKGDMLWVYEGLTQYLGKVLVARSGLRRPDEYFEDLALVAAYLDNRPGREWRPLQDVADAAQTLYGVRRAEWESWRRSTDFYDESNLIWLEADVIIRQMSGGKKSLDDFCRRFHGGESSGPMVKPYTFDDLVTALSEVVQYDWKTFFNEKLQSLSPRAPLGGIEKGGWKLVYRETPSGMQRAQESYGKNLDLRYSIGINLRDDGSIADVLEGSVASSAGLGPGMKIIAANGEAFSREVVCAALKESKKKSSPLEFLVANGAYVHTFKIDYHGGERYPHLERDETKPDLISLIIRPAAAEARQGTGAK
jgi:predicted metalloprotease with PDZ domain